MSDAVSLEHVADQALPASNAWQRALDLLARTATVIAATALLSLVAVEAWQVFARYVRNDAPGWTEPVALMLVNTAMMLGAAAGVHRDTHFGFVLLRDVAPAPVRVALRWLNSLVVATIGALLVRWGLVLAGDNWDVIMPGAGLPQGLMFVPTVTGGALIALFAVARLFDPRAIAPPPAQTMD